MITKKELTLDDYLVILRRRRWLLILPVIMCTVGGYALSRALPARYTSHTVVLVEQPVVPDTYVKPVVSEDLNQRLASMQEQILSRTRLQHLVEQFGMYKEDINRVPMEVLVARLQKSITVKPLNPTQGTQPAELPGFNVDVTLGEPWLAQRVCTEITSMFMEQNLKLRQQQAEDTTQFLGAQLEEAKTKLDEQDAKLAQFQSRYVGELPENEQNNLTLLMGLSPQLEAATQALNQAREQKAFVESMLAQQLATWQQSQKGQNPATLEEQLGKDREQLLALQQHYTDEYPDVRKLKKDIAELEARINEQAANKEKQPTDAQPKLSTPEPQEIQQLRAQLYQADLAVTQKENEQQQMQEQIRTLQGRLQLSPKVQQDFKALTRDYQTALSFYNDLLKKRNESQMATELEHRQQGEQFRVLDPPSFPERPSFPNRPLFDLGGFGAGLLMAIGLVELAEWRDKSMRTKQDIERYLRLPTLAQISLVDPSRRRKNGNVKLGLQTGMPGLGTSSGRQ
ncbi:MAG TPA: Wzz/FepE/Etk N-terminal domain-containing protein [Terriglobales bacterium]|nr:Wzz/FepE/Etk N-terminal domain-containing protein [Terriglobales bacterium]